LKVNKIEINKTPEVIRKSWYTPLVPKSRVYTLIQKFNPEVKGNKTELQRILGILDLHYWFLNPESTSQTKYINRKTRIFYNTQP